MINIELSRFKVLEGKSSKVDEWMKFLNDNMEDTLLTLEGEKMYVESIHREIIEGVEYLLVFYPRTRWAKCTPVHILHRH